MGASGSKGRPAGQCERVMMAPRTADGERRNVMRPEQGEGIHRTSHLARSDFSMHAAQNLWRHSPTVRVFRMTPARRRRRQSFSECPCHHR